MAPATASGKNSGGEMIRRKYRNRNGRRTGTIAAAGFREIQRHPMSPNAGRTRPSRGIDAISAMSGLPRGPVGPPHGEEEHRGRLDREGGRAQEDEAPGERLEARGGLPERGAAARR